MTASRRSLLVLAVAAALAGGCSASSDDTRFDDGEGEGESALRVLSTEIVGDIDRGATADVDYATGDGRRYRALRVRAVAGETIDVWVRSSTGDAVAYLLAPDFRTLRRNDDAAPGVKDAHVTVRAAQAGTYLVALKEKAGLASTFTVARASAGGVQWGFVPGQDYVASGTGSEGTARSFEGGTDYHCYSSGGGYPRSCSFTVRFANEADGATRMTVVQTSAKDRIWNTTASASFGDAIKGTSVALDAAGHADGTLGGWTYRVELEQGHARVELSAVATVGTVCHDWMQSSWSCTATVTF